MRHAAAEVPCPEKDAMFNSSFFGMAEHNASCTFADSEYGCYTGGTYPACWAGFGCTAVTVID